MYRNIQAGPGQVVPQGANLNDYSCRYCSYGCQNCSSNTTCKTCAQNFIPRNTSAGNSICIGCPAFCADCSTGPSPDAAVCRKCMPQFNPVNNGTKCQLNTTCQTGQWFNSATLQCKSCPSGCTTCKQGLWNGTVECLSCVPGQFLSNTTRRCACKCDLGRQLYDSKTDQCSACPSGTFPNQTTQSCQNCSKYCSSCYFQPNRSQSEDDDSGGYASVNINYQGPNSQVNVQVNVSWSSGSWNYTSSDRSNASSSVCTACVNGSYWDKNRGMCVLKCNSTAYFNSTQLQCINCQSDYYLDKEQCVKCPKNCTSCSLSTTGKTPVCQSCSTGFVVDFTTQVCRPNCPAPLAYNWGSQQCQACPRQTLFNTTTKQCQSCPKYCSSCYVNQTTGNLSCSNCTAGNIYDQSMKLCKTSCYGGTVFYWDTLSCRSCPPKQSFSYATQSCQSCGFGCTSCYNSYNNTAPACVICNSTTIYDYYTYQCKLPCPAGTIFNSDSKTCESCPAGQYYLDQFYGCQNCTIADCSLCTIDQTTLKQRCTNCKSGFTLNSFGMCSQACGVDQYLDQNTLQCKSCPEGTYLNGQTCLSCPSNCQSCSSSTGSLTCSSCKPGFNLDTQNQICYAPCQQPAPVYNATLKSCQACPTQTTWFQTYCQSCPLNCQGCSVNSNNQSQIVCPSCINGWILDPVVQQCRPSCPVNQQYNWITGQCSQCPSGQYLNKTQQRCQACPSNCLSCSFSSTTSSFTCSSCTAGYVVDSVRSICRPQCNQTQYFDWTSQSCMNCNMGQFMNLTTQKCQVCPPNCASCQPNLLTGIPECQTCRPGTIFEPQVKGCMLSCNSTTYYDWSSNSCLSCSQGSFLNPVVKACVQCPSGCTNCFFNNTVSSVQCNSCYLDQILDEFKLLCRVPCNSTAYFDWTYNMCINCASNAFVNPQTQQCTVCPSNCTQCAFETSSQQVQCQACSAGFVVDPNLNFTCRQQCNSTTYFDYSSKQCMSCPLGQWLNPNSGSCQDCPQGCYQCSQRSDGNPNPNCTQCYQGLVLDPIYQVCRAPCLSNQYFDFTGTGCSNCTYPCVSCQSSSQCTKCDVMYNLLSNSTCQPKCQAGYTVWSSQQQACVSIRNISVSLTQQASLGIRCTSNVITAQSSGLYPSESPVYSWNYSIASGGASISNWSPLMNTLLTTANSNNQSTFTLSSSLTEQVLDQTIISVIVTMKVGGLSVSKSINYTVQPYRYTTVGNYSSTYTINTTLGLAIYPTLFYPNCPAFQGPEKIPASNPLTCYLYDSKSNLITSLQSCTISPNQVAAGSSYFVKFSYVPNPMQSAIIASMTINTLYAPPSCSIQNSALMYVWQNQTLNMSVTVFNSNPSFKYSWACNPITAGASCGVMSTNQLSANMQVPASTLTLNAQYNYTLTISLNTVFQTSCSALVEVIPQTQAQFNLQFLDNSNSQSYLDPSLSQNIMCYQGQETRVQVQYDWLVIRQSDYFAIFNSSKSNGGSSIWSQGTNLYISPNLLSVDNYMVQCIASNMKYSGQIQKYYTTNRASNLFTPNFSLGPSSGVAQQTLFQLTVSKNNATNLWCNFGYVTNQGDLSLPNQQMPSAPAGVLTFISKLNSYSNTDQQVLYSNCFDSKDGFSRQTTIAKITQNSTTVNSNSFQKAIAIGIEPETLQVSTQASRTSVISVIPSVFIGTALFISVMVSLARRGDTKQVDRTECNISNITIKNADVTPTVVINETETDSSPSKLKGTHDFEEKSSVSVERSQSIFANAKIVKFVQRGSFNLVVEILEKILIANVFMACFSFGVIFSAKLDSSILAGVCAYLCTVVYEKVLICSGAQMLKTTLLRNCWAATLITMMAAQTILIPIMSSPSPYYGLLTSSVVFVGSSVVQDFASMWILNSIKKKINDKPAASAVA